MSKAAFTFMMGIGLGIAAVTMAGEAEPVTSTAADTMAAHSSATDERSSELPSSWRAELFFGGAASLPAKLTVRQLEQPPFDVHARYEGRSLEFPPYLSVRVARWEGSRAWALQATHHRIVLRDPPPEIQSFASGYNLLTLNRLVRSHGVVLGVGAGVVVVHPSNEVRGQTLADGGYSLAGPTGALSVGYDYAVGRDWLVTSNALFAMSYARVPVQDGHASAPDFSVHGQLGFGYRFARGYAEAP